MNMFSVRPWVLILACLACGSATADDSLYARLGGRAGVEAIAGALIDRAAADPLTGPTFKDTKLSHIKQAIADQVCELSAGPCHYAGDSMREVHAGLHIDQAQFYRLVALLEDVLRERHVDTRSTNELLRLLAPMKRDVVEHASAAPVAPVAPSP